jgi:hypothetical protein
MSVANQANEKLTQLVTLTAKIESYLNPAKNGKDSKQESAADKRKDASSKEEALAITGMSTAISDLIKQTSKVNPNAGKKIKDFLIQMSEGVKSASDNLKNVDSKEITNVLSTLVGGIAKFALGMVLVAVSAPLVAIGTLVFALSVRALMNILSTAQSVSNDTLEGINSVLSMAKGAALFSLSMILIAATAPVFALGVLVFTLAVSAMLLTFSLLKGARKGVMESLDTILSMAKSIALFSLVMVGIGLVSPLFAAGVIVFTLAMSALLLTFAALGKLDKSIKKTVVTLQALVRPIAILGALFFLIGLGASQVAIGALVTAGSLLVVGLAAAAVGYVDKFAKKGAATLNVLAPALILFSAAMFILAAAPGDPVTLGLKMAVIAGAIVVLGLAAYALGIPAVAPFAVIGAGVLVTLGAALVVFSAALFILSKAKFDKDQAENLGYTILEVGKSLAMLGLMSIPVFLGAAVLLPMSVALLPLTGALALFKTINWKESDGESLKNAIQSTVQAFTGAFKGIGVKEILKMLAVVPIIGMIGVALSSLALGIKAMATMTFTETEWDPKSGKLIPKKVVKLSDSEIQAVGPNIAKILNALSDPLLNFGIKAMKGPFSLFGGGYMMKGIKAAGRIGEVIASLAKGVVDMANLNVTEWEVKDGKLRPKSIRKLSPDDFTMAGKNTNLILKSLAAPLTEFGKSAVEGEGLFSSGYMVKGVEVSAKIGNTIASLAKGVLDMANLQVVTYKVQGGKLTPTSVVPLKTSDFAKAANNVNEILKALSKPLTDFGMSWKSGGGWFSKGDLEAGIAGLSKISDPIGKLAKMIVELAAGRATVSELRGGKLVPVSTVSFAQAIPLAITAIEKLLKTLPTSLQNFGSYYAKNEDAMELAGEGLDDVYDTIKTLGKIGAYLNDNEQKFSAIAKISPSLVPASANLAKIAKNYSLIHKNLGGPNGGFANFYKKEFYLKPLFSDLATSLDRVSPSLKSLDAQKVSSFDSVANTIKKLSSVQSPFQKFVKSFSIFTKDMSSFVNSFRKFGKDSASNFKVFGDGVDKISKVDTSKLQKNLQALREYAREEAAIEEARRKRESAKDVTREPSVNRALETAGRTTTTVGKETPPVQPVFPGRIENLTVTNLTVTGAKFYDSKTE